MVYIFLGLLVVAIGLIVVTLLTLPRLGDERKDFIKMKAQSYAFTIVIILLTLELIRNIYITIRTEETYSGMNPFSFLVAISVVYLVALQVSKKKYGG